MGLKLSLTLTFLTGSVSGLAIWSLVTDRLDSALKYQIAGYGCAVVYVLLFLALLYHISKLVRSQRGALGGEE